MTRIPRSTKETREEIPMKPFCPFGIQFAVRFLILRFIDADRLSGGIGHKITATTALSDHPGMKTHSNSHADRIHDSVKLGFRHRMFMIECAKLDEFASVSGRDKDTIPNFLFLVISGLWFLADLELAGDLIGPSRGVNRVCVCWSGVPLEPGIDGLDVNARVAAASCAWCACGGDVCGAGGGGGHAVDMGWLWQDGDGLLQDA